MNGGTTTAATVDATLAFLGAAGEVTGSSYLVETAGIRFLVDCGMFQGQDSDEKNASAIAFDVHGIDFVILSHAHIDHSGLLPLLVRRGFRGPILATPATCDLLGVMLPDSAHIQESNAAWARGRRKKSGRLQGLAISLSSRIRRSQV